MLQSLMLLCLLLHKISGVCPAYLLVNIRSLMYLPLLGLQFRISITSSSARKLIILLVHSPFFVPFLRSCFILECIYVWLVYFVVNLVFCKRCCYFLSFCSEGVFVLNWISFNYCPCNLTSFDFKFVSFFQVVTYNFFHNCCVRLVRSPVLNN